MQNKEAKAFSPFLKTKLNDELHGIFVIAKREFFSNFFSIKMLILFIILTLAVLGVAYGLSDASLKQNYIWNEQLNSDLILIKTAYTMVFVGSISAIALSFDSIVKEKLTGNSEILLTKPLNKRSVLIGKFLGITLSLSILVFFIAVVSLLTIIKITGNPPTFSASIGFLFFTIILLGTFVLIQQTLSSLAKSLGTAIVSGVALWFIFVLFWLLISSAVAYILGIPIEAKSSSDTPIHTREFQMLNVQIALLNPSGAYMLSIGMLIEGEKETALESIPFYMPFVSMFLWFFITLFLATEVFKRTQE